MVPGRYRRRKVIEGIPYNIDLILDLPEDPTELVTKNKEFLSDLRDCEFDGREIGKILKNYYGLRLKDVDKGLRIPKEIKKKLNKKGWKEFDDFFGHRFGNEPWPSKAELKKYKAEYKEFCNKIDYAIRSSNGLINNPFISFETKELLKKEVERLSKIKKQDSYENHSDRLLHPAESDVKEPAKTIMQMTGFQVVEIVKYIDPFREKTKRLWKLKAIFSLICEIFNELDSLKPYTQDDIKSLYDKNL
jgi:hypothetical protein